MIKISRVRKMYLVSISLLMIIFLSIPVLGNADVVPWADEQYTAYARADTRASDTKYGPPLPLHARAQWGGGALYPNYGTSDITSTNMQVYSQSANGDFQVTGSASFYGCYFATDTSPLFQFIYSGNYSYVNGPWGGGQDNYYHYAWLNVTDYTDNNRILYDNPSLTLDGTAYTIGVPTIAGHEIVVHFGAQSYSDDLIATTSSVNLNYSTAVAPEPVSSILFVTGGTLLAGRRFLEGRHIQSLE